MAAPFEVKHAHMTVGSQELGTSLLWYKEYLLICSSKCTSYWPTKSFPVI